MMRVHCANGGVSHEHSRHGSVVLILSPIFNVKFPYLQVCSDLARFPGSMVSFSFAIEGKYQTFISKFKKKKKSKKDSC